MSLRHRLATVALFGLVASVPGPAAAQIEEGRVPLQTARSELERFRGRYAELYNQKNAKELTAMYAEDAVVILPTGAVVAGRTAIGAQFAADAPNWPHMVIESDSVRVWGNTATDFGTVKVHPAGGGEIVSRYLVVLRRGYQDWSLVHVAQVPAGN